MDIETVETEPLPGGIAEQLVKAGVLTTDQWTYAQRVKGKMAAGKSLVEVLSDLGYLSRDAIRLQGRKSFAQLRTGPLLVDLGLLSAEQLARAVAGVASAPGKKLVALLAEEGYLPDTVIADSLASFLGLPLTDLAFSEPDREMCAQVPSETCRQHAFIPVTRIGEQVQVAFADPLDGESRAAVTATLGRQIVPLIAPFASILAALNRLEQSPTAVASGAAEQWSGIIAAAQDAGARTIHLEPLADRLRIRFRVDGLLTLHRDLPLEAKRSLIPHIQGLVLASRTATGVDSHHLCTDDGAQVQIQISSIATDHGERLVVELGNRFAAIPELKSLGMAPRLLERYLYDVLESPNGITVIAGPAGSGTTTTLYSSIGQLAVATANIMTIEEQIEFPLADIAQCLPGPKNGTSLADLLTTVTRQDPDVIAIGMRPSDETMARLMRLAMTGQKMLVTSLGEDTVSLLSLLLADKEPFLITAALNSLLAQRLLRTVCPQCAKPYIPSPQELNRIGLSQEFLQGARFMAGQGCKACQFSGYHGRLALFELLVLNEPIREAILARKGSAEILRISRETAGFVSLFEDGLAKAARGLVHVRDLIRCLPKTGKPRPINELKRILGEHQ